MIDRRRFLALAGVFLVENLHATPAQMQAAMRKVLGDARPRPGKVKLEIAPLVDYTLSLHDALPI